MARGEDQSVMRDETHNHAEAAVRVEGLSKSSGRVRALDRVGFSIRLGEILGLIGPNGRGWFGARGLGRNLLRPDAGGRAAPFSGIVLRPPDGTAPWLDQPVH